MKDSEINELLSMPVGSTVRSRYPDMRQPPKNYRFCGVEFNEFGVIVCLERDGKELKLNSFWVEL